MEDGRHQVPISTSFRATCAARRQPPLLYRAAGYLLLCVFLAPLARSAPVDGDLRIEMIAAYNLVVDSNVESPSTYAPEAAYMGARICNDGANAMSDVFAYIGNFTAATPGVYPSVTNPATGQVGTFALTHEGGAADATRYIGNLAGGECKTQYWLVSYPRLDDNGDSVTRGIKPDDDLILSYDVWATGDDAGTALAADTSRNLALRNEISAMANKIWPNGDNKVPDEYKAAIDELLGWDTATPRGTNAAYPGELVTTQGIWYDFGNVGQGFDNDGDFVPDQNAWMQPVGDPGTFDASCFRLVHTYGLVIVKLKSGGEYLIPFEDRLYFENIPDNTGAVGLVFYEFVALNGTCQASMSPYQEVASGYDNEKFNGDYGHYVPPLSSLESAVTLDKTVDLSQIGPSLPATLEYTLTLDNTGPVDAGDPSLGVALVIQDGIPVGTEYVAGSAAANNLLPVAYTVLYSSDNGASWSLSEPATASSVTDIQWWLDAALASGANGDVTFQVSVPGSYGGALVQNTGGLSFGNTAPFVEDTATTFVIGVNSLSGTVFEDDGSGNGTVGNGIQDGGEADLGAVSVALFYDANGNGLVDNGDAFWGTTETAAGSYGFTNLPDGSYLAVVDDADTDLPIGYGATSDKTLTIDLDSAATDPNPVNNPNVDFGFAPPLSLSKTAPGDPIYEGDEVTYTLALGNNLASSVANECPIVVWASAQASQSDNSWTNPAGAFAAGGPDGNYAMNDYNGSNKVIAGTGFNVGGRTDTITSVEVIYSAYLSNTLTDDVTSGELYFNDDTNPIASITFSIADINALGPNAASQALLVWDVSGAKTWDWADFGANLDIVLTTDNTQNFDGAVLNLDALGFRITTDACAGGGTFDPETTLSPVPLTDSYDPSKLQFVSASITPDSTSPAGTLSWNDVGPIDAGETTTVNVTFRALEPAGNAAQIITNSATASNVFFADGDSATGAGDAVDVTLQPTGSLTGTIWSDIGTIGWVGADGYEGSDPLVGGVSVNLYACLDGSGELLLAGADTGRACEASQNGGTWTLIDTATTDGNGDYLFAAVRDGYYYVAVDSATLPGTVGQTGDPDDTGGQCTTGVGSPTCSDTWTDPADDLSLVLAINGANDLAGGNFGYSVNPALYGTLWQDHDADGSRDPGDDALAGWVVSYTGSDASADSSTTGADGSYSFGDLTAGVTYTLTVTTPSGETWTQTFETDTSVDNSTAVTPSAGQVSGPWDFAFTETGSSTVGDTVYYDWNGDGVQSAGEDGIQGVNLALYRDSDNNGVIDGDDPLVATATSGAAGGYSFTTLPAGDYLVLAGQPANTLPSADPDEPGTGCSICDSLGAVTLDGSGDNLDMDFGYRPAGGATLGDSVWIDANGDGEQSGPQETGIADISVQLWADPDGDATFSQVLTTTTDAGGNYRFDGLPDGDYRIVTDSADADLPTDLYGNPYYTTTAVSYEVTVSGGVATSVAGSACTDCDNDADFGFAPLGSIGDTVFWDANGNSEPDYNEDRIGGVLVTLGNASATATVIVDGVAYAPGATIATTTTNVNGNYLFDGLPPGDYSVTVDTTGPIGGAAPTGDPDRDGVACADNTYPGLPACDSATTTTLLSGTYFMGADFGYQPPGVIGDFIWLDADGDTVQDAGEPGIGGVQVNLLDSGGSVIATTATDVDGGYSFANIGDGSYTVEIDASNFLTGGALDNRAPTYDADGGLDSRAGATLSGGSVLLDRDFGYRLDGPSSLAGTLCFDDDASPDRLCANAPDDIVLAGASVYLYLSDGTFLASTGSDANGDYSFDNLPDGDYVVSVGTALAPLDTAALTTTSADTDATAVTSNAASVTQQVSINGGGGAVTIVDLDFAFESTQEVDYGDLPAPYSSTLGEGGARHLLPAVPDLYLGVGVDGEADATTNATASGDDNSGVDDEDGVSFGDPSTWTVGNVAGGDGGSVDIVVGGTRAGYLVVWIDFNGDGDFGDGGEMIVSQAVGAGSGTAAYNFAIPAGTSLDGTLYSRARLFAAAPSIPALAYNGTYDNGEVEDYAVVIGAAPAADPATLGNAVWVDENGDGLRTAGEPGLANVSVELTPPAGVDLGNGAGVAISTATDADGGYIFTGLPPGDYSVAVAGASLPAGAVVSAAGPNAGSDDNSQTQPYHVTLTSGEENTSADFGYNWASAANVTGNTGTGAIGDRVWIDANGDGIQDPGEAGFGNVDVKLYSDPDGDGVYDNLVDTVSSGPDGRYVFSNVAAGAYLVEVNDGADPAGYTQSGDPDNDGVNDNRSAPLVLAPGDVFLNADFGYQPAGASNTLGDTIFFDADGNGSFGGSDYGIAGVSVTLLDAGGKAVATVVTDAGGAYNFAGLADGSYTVWVNDADQVLGELAQSGEPDNAADGGQACGVCNGRNTVTVSAGGGNLNQDFGYAPAGHGAGQGLIGDTVYLDTDGSGNFDSGEGLEGVTVDLLDAGNNVIASTVTDENGRYYFGALADGSYTVQVIGATLPAGGAGLSNFDDPESVVTGAGDGQAAVTISGGNVDLAQDFGYQADTPASLSGNVWNDTDADGTRDETGTGIGGVTVVLRDTLGKVIAAATTQADGSYEFTHLPAGDYLVDVTDSAGILNGYWHSLGADSEPDPTATVTLGSGTPVNGIDFGYYRQAGEVGDVVFNDLNGDGLRNPATEPGLAGVALSLTISYPNASTVTVTTLTDETGHYRFGNLLLDEGYDGYDGTPDGSNSGSGGLEPSYSLSVAGIGGGYSSTYDNTPDAGGLGNGSDDNADNPGGELAFPPQGGVDASNDFGYQPGAGIGDRVWLDLDGDGVQDASEAGIANVTVELRQAGSVIATAVTDGNGRYLFAGLNPAAYSVTVAAANFNAGGALAGYAITFDEDDGTTAPDGASGTISVGPSGSHLSADFGYRPSGNASIGNQLWIDSDADGVKDAAELGLSGVTLVLTDAGADGLFDTADDISQSTVSNATGQYLFTGLMADDNYRVQVETATLPAGYTLSYDPDDPTNSNGTFDGRTFLPLADGETNLAADFGYQAPGGQANSVGDVIYNDLDGNGSQNGDEPGLAGVTVALVDDLGGNGDWDAGEPILANATTDAAGQYLFSDVPDGRYLVAVTDTANVLAGKEPSGDPDGGLDGYSAVALDPTGASAGGVDDTDQDFGYRQPDSGNSGVIGDTVFLDVDPLDGNAYSPAAGDQGLSGVTVRLYRAGADSTFGTTDDQLVQSDVSDNDGQYLFSGLDPAASYQVRIDGTTVTGGLSNSVDPDLTLDGSATVDLGAAGGGSLSQDFGYAAANGNTIGGTLWRDDIDDGALDVAEAARFANVTLQLRDGAGNVVATAVTDAAGEYSFAGLADGSYTVVVTDLNNVLANTQHTDGTPGVDNQSQDDSGYTISVSGGVSNTTADFGYKPIVTNPVTLAWVRSQRGVDATLVVEWATASELGHLGFALQLQDADGTWQALQGGLIVADGDSVGGGDYALVLESANWVQAFKLIDVALDGRHTAHGPFAVGAVYGERTEPAAIDWAQVHGEQAAHRATRAKAGAAVPALRLTVNADGVYRVSGAELATAGFDVGVAREALALRLDGRPVARRVVPGRGAGRGLGMDGYVEFIARARDSLYGDDNVYVLSVDAGAARPVDTARASVSARTPAQRDYRATLTVNEARRYSFSAPGEDPWFAERLLADGGPVSHTETLSLEGYAGGTVELELDVWGVTSYAETPDHHVVLELDGQAVAARRFDGRRAVSLRASTPTAPAQMTLRLPHDASTSGPELVHLDGYRVHYRRALTVRDGALRFGAEPGAEAAEVGGLSGRAVTVYRERPDGSVARLSGVHQRDDRLRFAVEAGAEYLVVEDRAVRTPRLAPAAEPAPAPDGATVLVVVPDYLAAGLQRWVDWRRDQGYSVEVVILEQLYAAYSNHQVDAETIAAHVRAAYAAGTDTVLLVGADSYDYHDHLGLGAVSVLPSLYRQTDELVRFAPADAAYADVDGDDVPDLALGRWPVRTAAELAQLIDHSQAYAAKGYARSAVLAADRFDTNQRYDFRADSEALAERHLSDWTLTRAYIDDLGVAGARQALLEGIERGAALTSFFGHSATSRWSFDNLLRLSDLRATLDNAGRPTVVTQWGCWNTYYVDPYADSLGHAFLLAGDRGAAAVMGASTLTEAAGEAALSQALYTELLTPGTTLGEAVLRAKQQLAALRPGQRDILLGWQLLGDPLLLIEE